MSTGNCGQRASGNVLILAFTLAVIMLGYGIIMPIIPFYIDRLGASGRPHLR